MISGCGRGQGNAAVGGKKHPDQGPFLVRGDCVSVAAHEGGFMPRFLRRHVLAVLTIAALASFHIAGAQNAIARRAPPSGTTPAWTVADGALTTQAEAGKTPPGFPRHACRQHHLLRIPRARRCAAPRCTCRAGMPSSSSGMATGSPSTLRFRAPRFDAGFNKLDNAFVLDVRNGTDFRRNVLFEGPATARIWHGEDRRGPSFIFVSQAGPFALRNARHRAGRLRTAERCPRPPAATPTRRISRISSRSARRPSRSSAAKPAIWWRKTAPP